MCISMKKTTFISLSVLLGAMLASLFIFTHYFGYLAQRIDDEGYIALGIGVLMPALLILVINLNERVKKIVLFACCVLFVIGSYVVMLGNPNFPIPDFSMDLTSTYFFFLSTGGLICAVQIAAADLVRAVHESKSWVYFALAMGLGGFVTFTALFLAPLGWLFLIMVVDYVLPAALLVYFLFYPDGVEGEASMKALHAPSTSKAYSIHDTTKGLKLALYTILTCFAIIATLGLNGMALEPSETIYNGSWMWLGFAIGGVAIIFIAKMFAKDVFVTVDAPDRKPVSQLAWIMTEVIQLGLSVFVAIAVLYVPGFHGTILAYILAGIAVGFNIGAFFTIIAQQHPPKSVYAYLSLLTFFLVFTVVATNYLKTLISDYDGLLDIAEYIMYVLGALVIILVVLIIAQAVTISKTRAKGTRPVAPAATVSP